MAPLEEMETAQEESSEQHSFQFVDVVAGPTGKAKAAQRRVIRSNAARYQWSQTKSNSKATAKGTKKTTRKPKDTTSAKDEHENASKALQITGSQTLLDQSASLSKLWLSLPGEDDCDLLKFNFDIILPALLPPLRNGVENPAAVKWAQLAFSSPTLFQIWMRCGAIHRKVLRGESLSDSPRLVRADAHVIKLLNQEMQNPESACKDENILAVGGMAHYGWENVDENPKKTIAPSQGPLKGLQGLDTYSVLRAVRQHLDGLEILVKLRGGLGKIEAKGLTGLINYMDVMEATRDLRSPRYPFIITTKSLETSLSARFDATNHIPLSANSGCGFPIQWQESTFPPLQDLYSVIQDVYGYTIMVSEHCQGIQFQGSLADFADRRNYIQHRVMSLPHHPSAQGGAEFVDLYEATRLATIIYSLLVVFPISAQTAPFPILATLLRKELLVLVLSNRPYEELALISWVLVMGCIAAIDTDERSWFVYALNNISYSLSLVEWDDLKHLLKQFLWLDTTNDIDGLSLWLDITKLRPIFARITPALSFTNSTTPSVQERGTPVDSPSGEQP